MTTRTIAFLCYLTLCLPAKAELRVFACEPEWAALVEQLAGDRASVFAAVTGVQDVHHIQARPSLIAQVRRADLVVCTGAGLEAGWLPVLLKRAGNPGVRPGADGYFLATDHVHMLGVPGQVDRSMGDVHPHGNPHIQLDPRNYVLIARALAERLAMLDNASADFYEARTEDFLQRWNAAMQQWTERAKPLKGMAVVVYHDAWIYMNHWLDLKQLAELEPKPGVPPTSRHLSSVLSLVKSQPARAIIRAPYQDTRATDWLHKHTDIPALVLPTTVGGTEQAGNLFELFDTIIDLLLGVSG